MVMFEYYRQTPSILSGETSPDATVASLWTSDPVRLTWPQPQLLPVVVASPHSGRTYPRDFVAQTALPRRRLRATEDSFVEEIFAGAPELGAPLLAALFPRIFIDVNSNPL